MLFYSTLSMHRFITIRYIQRYFNDQVFLCTKLRDLRERMEERKKTSVSERIGDPTWCLARDSEGRFTATNLHFML